MKDLRQNIQQNCYLADESVLRSMVAWAPSGPSCKAIAVQASIMVENLRNEAAPSIMELFLGEYGLSSEEGVALMCLAEALLRVPDSTTGCFVIFQRRYEGFVKCRAPRGSIQPTDPSSRR